MRQWIKHGLTTNFPTRSKTTPGHRSQPRPPSEMKDKPGTMPDPTALEILQYRYHYGTNLGSVFVLERWLSRSAFPPDSTNAQSSELEAVKAWTSQIGTTATKDKFEKRWTTSISPADWDWLSDIAHCTTIRLPVGYFTLGRDFCNDTPFAPYAQVYENAWFSVESFVAQARSRNIGVLLDLHALPGGANSAEHSGTNSGAAALWKNKKNLKFARDCIIFMAKEIASGKLDGVVGLEICNEAKWKAPGLHEFYDSVISAVSAIDPTIVLYISDAWNLKEAISYVKRKNRLIPDAAAPRTNPVCIDTHKYFCFTDDNKSPEQIVTSISIQLSELDDHGGSVVDSGAVQVVVGEWSCTLSSKTWSRIAKGGDRSRLTAQFGQAQCRRWQQKSAGSYFWTYKMDWMNGGDWGFVEQTNSQAILAPQNLTMPDVDVRSVMARVQLHKDAQAVKSYDNHVQYWHHADPGGRYEHWRFQSGWEVGWNDALTFFSARTTGKLEGSGSYGGDKIGLTELWIRKRISDSGMTGSLVWEYETGMRCGMADFYDLCQI